MARTPLNPFQPPKGPVSSGAADVTLVAGDNTNGHSVPHTGRELIIAQGAGTVSIDSAPDELGRVGDVATYAVSASPKISVFGPFDANGWRQTDGTLHIDVSANTVLIGIVRIPEE